MLRPRMAAQASACECPESPGTLEEARDASDLGRGDFLAYKNLNAKTVGEAFPMPDETEGGSGFQRQMSLNEGGADAEDC